MHLATTGLVRPDPHTRVVPRAPPFLGTAPESHREAARLQSAGHAGVAPEHVRQVVGAAVRGVEGDGDSAVVAVRGRDPGQVDVPAAVGRALAGAVIGVGEDVPVHGGADLRDAVPRVHVEADGAGAAQDAPRQRLVAERCSLPVVPGDGVVRLEAGGVGRVPRRCRGHAGDQQNRGAHGRRGEQTSHTHLLLGADRGGPRALPSSYCDLGRARHEPAGRSVAAGGNAGLAARCPGALSRGRFGAGCL